MNTAALHEAADEIAEWSSANLDRIGIHMPDFSPIRTSVPCMRKPATRAHQVTLSGHPAVKTLCQSVLDAREAQHLSANDILEHNDDLARRNVGDKHIAEALAMVQDNLQDKIAAGLVSVNDAAILMAFFERIDEVACECSAADLRGAA